jgi:hypothetical protein
MESKNRGVLDPRFRGDDGFYGAALGTALQAVVGEIDQAT